MTRVAEREATAAERAWQDAVQAQIDGFFSGWQRWAQLSAQFAGPFWPQQANAGAAIERIAAGTRELAEAQMGVAAEWLRSPMWFGDADAFGGLQTRYERLFDAGRELALAYIDAFSGWQRETSAASEETAAAARDVVNTSARTAERVTREAGQAGRNGASRVARAARDAGEQVSEANRALASAAVEAAAEIAEQAADATLPIKGNVNAHGERIHHLPGQPNYDQVDPEERFANEAAAQAAGYRRAATPGGGNIRGHVNRAGDRIYHLPGQANYDRIDADMLFETEAEAQAAGFRPAQR
jgi:hypothetical protein